MSCSGVVRLEGVGVRPAAAAAALLLPLLLLLPPLLLPLLPLRFYCHAAGTKSPNWRRSWRRCAKRTTSACGGWLHRLHRPTLCGVSWSTAAASNRSEHIEERLACAQVEPGVGPGSALHMIYAHKEALVGLRAVRLRRCARCADASRNAAQRQCPNGRRCAKRWPARAVDSSQQRCQAHQTHVVACGAGAHGTALPASTCA